MTTQHAQTVRELYEAFGRGDVAAILARVSDDTEWTFNVSASDVPWHRPVHGKSELPTFFANFGGNVTLQAFEPGEFVTAANQVIVPIHIRYVVNRTGKTVDMYQVHWWRFDGAGNVSGLVHFEDTAAVQAAYRS